MAAKRPFREESDCKGTGKGSSRKEAPGAAVRNQTNGAPQGASVEDTLRKSEGLYRDLVEGTSDLLTRVDGDGRFVYVNRAAETILGVKPEACVGLSAFDFVHPEDRERTQEWFEDCAGRQATAATIENRQVSRTGDVRHMLWTCNFYFDDLGTVVGVNSIARDITERKRAEEERRKKDSLNQLFLDSLPPLAMLLRKGTREIVASNKAGQEVGAVPGRTCYETWGQSAKPCPWCRAPALWKTGEAQHSQPEGVGCVWDSHWIPVSDDLYLHYASDITESKRAEEEREKLVSQLEAKNSELDQFAYRVSHDLKSPLITINGFVGVLKEDLAQRITEEEEGHLGRISSAANKMRGLLDDVLELSRIGRAMNPPKQVRLEEVANEAVELLAGRIEQRRVEVTVSPDLPVIHADHSRLLEVLQNLIENSVKYMGDQPEPSIEIGIRQDGNQTVCLVRDNGIGIEPKHHEKVFEIFDKLDRASEGTGIGLAIARRIIEVHGGQIWVESEGAGKGATFCFTIPAKNDNGM